MVQHDMSLKDSEIDDLRRDNLKLFEKIRFLQSYSSQVRRQAGAPLTEKSPSGRQRLYLSEDGISSRNIGACVSQ